MFDKDVVIESFRLSIGKDNPYLYMKGIWKKWKDEGVITLEQVQASNARHEKNKPTNYKKKVVTLRLYPIGQINRRINERGRKKIQFYKSNPKKYAKLVKQIANLKPLMKVTLKERKLIQGAKEREGATNK